MGLLDRARAALGLGGAATSTPAGPATKGRGERPKLRDQPPASSAGSIEDALAARAEGRPEEAHRILSAIDRGKGLRAVLRAAAALEADDAEELGPCLDAIAASETGWRLALQIAGALGPADAALRARLVAFAEAHKAPAWALAWTRATGADAAADPRAKVDLLFADAPLARTVAAREWKIPGAADDPLGVERYATFSHGRDVIGRFGAPVVAKVFARAFDPSLDEGGEARR